MIYPPLIFLCAILICSTGGDDVTSSDTTSSAPVTTENLTTSSTSTPTTVHEGYTFENVSKLCTILDFNATQDEKQYLNKFFTQAVTVLKRIRDPEAVGIPEQTILEDPLKIRNSSVSVAGWINGDFYDITVHGLSNFTIESTSTDLDDLQVYVKLKMKQILILGNCTIDTIFGVKSQGPFNFTLTDVLGEGTVYLAIDQDGHLVTSKSISQMTYQELSVSTTSSMSLFLNGAGTVILAALKPDILNQIDERITQQVNASLRGAPRLPCIRELPPIDLAINEGRKIIGQNYDPIEIKKVFSYEDQYFALSINSLKIRGLSRFSRVGKVVLKMINRTMQMEIRVITGRLVGQSSYYFNFGKVEDGRKGVINFTVEHLQLQARVNQSVDGCRQPILDDIQFEMGDVAVSLDGKGPLIDYTIELMMQFMPPMLRHMIVDELELPIKNMLQTQLLDRLDMKELKYKSPLFSALGLCFEDVRVTNLEML